MLFAKWLPKRRTPGSLLVPLGICVVCLQFVIITRMENRKHFTLYGGGSTDAGQVSSSYADYLPGNARHHRDATSEFSSRFGGLNQDNCTCGLHFRIDTKEAVVYAAPNSSAKKFLTIGIPTVKREKEGYINQTVRSLIDNMDDEDKNDVLIVILVADTDPVLQSATSRGLHDNFKQDIEAGYVQVIKSPQALYSSFKVTKRTYGQDIKHVTWRSKQNFDYAYLMKYSSPLAQYYMQLEDDVITTKDYVRAIRGYIQKQNDSWACLEFCELGFIGKLFKSDDLERLAQVLLMFYQEQPGDYVYLYFNMLMAQYGTRLRTPTLFQHKGTQSSLPGKIQPLKDRFFDYIVKTYKGDNPPAEIYSTLKTYQSYLPKLPYIHDDGFFWSHGAPDVGDYFLLVFDEPQSIARVIVETGTEARPTDKLEHGKLVASLTLLKSASDRLTCANDIDLGEFQKGRIEVNDVGSKVMFKVMCLQIKVLQKQEAWMIIREIAVFVQPPSS